MLKPSSQEMLNYTAAVNTKYAEILGKMSQKNKELGFSNEFFVSRRRMIQLIERYKRADFRHSEQEEGAVEWIARWCIEKWGELTGQDQGVHVVNRSDLDARTAPPVRRNPFQIVRASGLYGPDGRQLLN